MNFDKVTRGEKVPTLKLAVVQYAVLALMLALTAGLWRLQILGAQNFKMLAEQNRVRKVPVLAPRGKLFDRENRLVVDNYPSVSCFLVREQNRNVDADLPLIAKGLHLDLDQLRATLHRYRTSPGYQPIPIKQDVSADEQAFIEAHRNELPELETIEGERRLYPRDGFASALIGYVGEVSEDDLNQTRYAAYEPGDVVGKAGVEEMYDQLLRGQDGSRDVVVDSHGREVGYLGTQHAVPGQDLKLTIDNDLQKAAELAMGDRTGAIVAMDPRNGDILAMVSRPSFDPNAFAVKIDRAEWNKLITDPDHPLMNKAIQAQLAPGSTFKILMSVAGLQEGIAQNLKVNCTGGWGPYGFFHHCDAKHGAVDIHNAIPYSCDTYYYQLGDKLGIDRIAKYATEFGYGQKTGIDLPGEQAGLMPSAHWLMKNYHRKWYPDETLDVAIGQGAVEATPLQLARIIGGIASGGHLVRPRVVFPDQLPADFRKDLLESLPGSGDVDIPIDPANWEIITDGMAEVTQPAAFHTAGSAHLEGIDLAGKTGTAQVMSHEALDKTAKGHNTRPNVWFIGVVPRRNPELVVAVLWEHGEFSYYPARLGARFVAAYVEKQRKLAHNLVPVKVPAQPPVEVGAVWTTPNPRANEAGESAAKIHAGKFYVGADGAVTGASGIAQAAKTGKAAQVVSGAAKNRMASTAKQTTGSEKSLRLNPGKSKPSSPESASLSSMPALPAKPATVKSQ
ncbi:MAG: penicillin-binding protein 2 [Terracidiphilus sp.]